MRSMRPPSARPAFGQPLANARAMCPDLKVFDADVVADAKTLSDIADWCDRFTPLVALDPPHGLFLDITGCAHLFGGEAALLQTLVRRCAPGLCRQRRDRRHLGLRAHADAPASGSIVADGGEAEAVDPFPVSALGADEAITTGLRRAGLKTIGDVASRAPHEITARFGARFTTLLAHALGRAMRRSARENRCRITSWKSALPSRSRPTP